MDITELEQLPPIKKSVPELNLLAAIMYQAIFDSRLKPEGQDSYFKHRALKWINSEERAQFNSFLNLCCVLDINPERVRALVR